MPNSDKVTITFGALSLGALAGVIWQGMILARAVGQREQELANVQQHVSQAQGDIRELRQISSQLLNTTTNLAATVAGHIDAANDDFDQVREDLRSIRERINKLHDGAGK